MTNKVKAATLAAALGLVATGSASAQMSADMNKSNTFGDMSYATVTVDTSGNDINFMVDVNPSVYDSLTNFGFQSFGFNFNDALGLTAANINLGGLGWGITLGKQQSEFGNFDVVLEGTGSNRQTSLNFSITGISGDTVADYFEENANGYMFASHVAGFNVNSANATSHFIGGVAPVPELETWLMMMIGVGAMGYTVRRKRAATA